ncbi:TIGR04141 family sporadically distributed protein [Actinoplanes sp. TBRC 11911]|uniref:DUF6119 family protein n=1 Tax=Actinoplanes sp. TBRC 11911 TaxID=2729386 RepID=UPI00145EE0AD|nr:DUF6119 family protein [Actinoplanes sp. TBRC 11911]NMO54538.1 TIGR04141 family sporadically distributed protein [Actinoplanes sp. TBRC 11911]
MLTLNAFLLKRAIEPLDAFTDLDLDPKPTLAYLDDAEWCPLNWAEADVMSAARAGDVFVVLVARRRSAPRWQEFLAREVTALAFEDPPLSYGAVVLCTVDESNGNGMRWLAWCFGSGSRMIRRSAQDPRFGLTIALNMLAGPKAPEQIIPRQRRGKDSPHFRHIGYRTTAPWFQQTGHRAARDIPLDGFRIDRRSDLIASIGGRITSPSFTSSVTGGRSIRFGADLVRLSELLDLSATLLGLSSAADYVESLPWVDNIKLIENDDVTGIVKDHLIRQLQAQPVPPSVDAILPDDLDVEDERPIRFILFPGEHAGSASRVNLTIEMISDRIRRSNDAADLLSAELRFLDDAHESLGRVRLVDCICADMIIGDEQYLAYDGDFYRVNQSFVQSIDGELARLEMSSIRFPAYRGETEPEYIEKIRSEDSDRFVILDRKLIRLDNEAGIETSDLVSRSGALIHLKRKGKSSTLSHLFLQAANSCELLRRSVAARRVLEEMVRKNSESSSLTAEIAQVHTAKLAGNGVEVVFGFLGDWRGRSITSLPLFSRISLVLESRRVDGLGFKPTIALIDSADPPRSLPRPARSRRS